MGREEKLYEYKELQEVNVTNWNKSRREKETILKQKKNKKQKKN